MTAQTSIVAVHEVTKHTMTALRRQELQLLHFAFVVQGPVIQTDDITLVEVKADTSKAGSSYSDA